MAFWLKNMLKDRFHVFKINENSPMRKFGVAVIAKVSALFLLYLGIFVRLDHFGDGSPVFQVTTEQLWAR